MIMNEKKKNMLREESYTGAMIIYWRPPEYMVTNKEQENGNLHGDTLSHILVVWGV